MNGIIIIFSQIPGESTEESEVLKGVMINKDVTHPRMRRRIENPRIVLLDCNLEYKKGESQVRREGGRGGREEERRGREGGEGGRRGMEGGREEREGGREGTL